MARIPESKWKWFGHAGHLIVAADCQFHLCTQVGQFVISTVGDYRPHRKRKGDNLPEPEQVGYDRLYETYVFRTDHHKPCTCGCGMPSVDYSEIDSLWANTATDARDNHITLCNKYSRQDD